MSGTLDCNNQVSPRHLVVFFHEQECRATPAGATGALTKDNNVPVAPQELNPGWETNEPPNQDGSAGCSKPALAGRQYTNALSRRSVIASMKPARIDGSPSS